MWSFYEQVNDVDRAMLSDVERAVAAICDLRQEVNSGGFDSYLRYWGGDSAPDAVVALPDVLGRDWADLLRQAMLLLGDAYPADANRRQERLETLDLADALEQLDDRFLRLEATIEADALLTAYLAAAPH